MKTLNEISDLRAGSQKLKRLRLLQTVLIVLLFALLFFIFILSGI